MLINKQSILTLKDKLENALELHEYQIDRGYNTIRQEMIQELLLDVQQEVVHLLAANNESNYR